MTIKQSVIGPLNSDRRSLTVILMAVIAAFSLMASHSAQAANPANFLFLDADDMADHREMLARPDIQGGQIIYSWRQLELKKDKYDFKKIERDLSVAQALHKKLWVSIDDRNFSLEWKNIPDYLTDDPIYGGGITFQHSYPGVKSGVNSAPNGTVAMQWNPEVRARYQKLLRAIASRFDGRIYGIDLGETAMSADLAEGEKGFTCDGYFAAELENANVARQAFRKTKVVMGANFWPCEWNDNKRYMSRAFAYAASHGIGMGGPDIYPYHPGHTKNSYRFLNMYKGKLDVVAMAVQQPDLEFIDSSTGKPFTKESFTRFAGDYLGADIIFWTYIAPWLQSSKRR